MALNRPESSDIAVTVGDLDLLQSRLCARHRTKPEWKYQSSPGPIKHKTRLLPCLCRFPGVGLKQQEISGMKDPFAGCESGAPNQTLLCVGAKKARSTLNSPFCAEASVIEHGFGLELVACKRRRSRRNEVSEAAQSKRRRQLQTEAAADAVSPTDAD